MIDELYLYSCANEPNKSPWREGSGPFSFERSATSPPQADHVLIDLFSSVVDVGLRDKALWQEIVIQLGNIQSLEMDP